MGRKVGNGSLNVIGGDGIAWSSCRCRGVGVGALSVGRAALLALRSILGFVAQYSSKVAVTQTSDKGDSFRDNFCCGESLAMRPSAPCSY